MWHRRVLNFRIIYNVTDYTGYLSTQFAELEFCQVTPDTSGNPVAFQWGSRKYPGNTDRDEIVGGNNDVYIWISMLTEICSSGFERLVYKFSHSVINAPTLTPPHPHPPSPPPPPPPLPSPSPPPLPSPSPPPPPHPNPHSHPHPTLPERC